MRNALRRRLAASGDDRGAALVAAVAVALIGIMLVSVVVANAVAASQDSGEDRARTSGIHTAEGAVDAVYAELETWTPCSWPAAGPLNGGTSPSRTTATATVQYFSASGVLLTCGPGGSLTGGPLASAVVTATATAADGTRRTVQSKVALTPSTTQGSGAAIFAANSIMTTNNFTVTTTLPDTDVDVWVDGGNVNCNSNVQIKGNLIVVNGTVDISNSCRVTGNLWSKKQLTVHQAAPGGLQTVGQSLYVTANASLAAGTRIGGDVVLTGALSGGTPIVGGAIRQGVAPANIPQYVPVKLPEVLYRPADWTGFVNTGDRQAAYRTWVRAQAAANGAPSWADAMNPARDQCRVAGASYDANGPLVGPTVPTVFDTTNCAETRFEGGLNIKLRSDMVIFAKSFYSTGDFKVTSADGAQHKFWVIVPDRIPNGIAECSGGAGNIKNDSGSLAIAPITLFMYTPCTIDTNNSTDFYGQLYGGTVQLRNSMTMNYVPIGIPGVVLPSTDPISSAGYRVDVVFKREIRNP
ncbi:hypothetical protein [Cellulomonas sp. Root137]|uniref:hypothetical protein n=1 Tax=Cellulomonas sp. Root137 TaxID=1736459 RepID=UPI0006F724C1|nr:hypothetical protein [Cellulomonas sp. Root137]KQY44072.1 hypothetical protein ASD18_17205 [Cellulomonas sp. Root137]